MSDVTHIKTKKSLGIIARINELGNKNLKIDNYADLYQYINNIGTYYHLVGYRYILEKYDVENDNYNNHKSSELISLCEIDKKTSIILFEEIRRIEESLRTKLANLCLEEDLVTFQIDEEKNCVLLKDNYFTDNKNVKNKFFADDIFISISNLLYEDIKKVKKENTIRHYLDEYDNLIPIWVIVNFLSLGTLINLISSLSSKKISEFMNKKNLKYPHKIDDPCLLDLKAIQMLRNKISHHQNILGKESPYIFRNKKFSIYELGIYAICRWEYFLFNDQMVYNRIQNSIKKVIKEYNSKNKTKFSENIILNKNLK